MADGGKRGAQQHSKPVLTLSDEGLLGLDRQRWVNTSLEPKVRSRLLDVEERVSASIALMSLLRRDETHTHEVEACGGVDYIPIGAFFRGGLMAAAGLLMSDVTTVLSEVSELCKLPGK